MQQRKDKNVGPVTGPIETALMRELYFGVREGLPRGTSLAEARRLKPDIAIEDTHIVTSENPSRETIKLSLGDNGGETVESVLARIEGLLAHSHLIAESHHSQQVDAGVDKSESLPCPIVWVTHGGFIRCFLNHFANLSVLQEHAFSAEVSQVFCELVECMHVSLWFVDPHHVYLLVVLLLILAVYCIGQSTEKGRRNPCWQR